MKFGRVSGDKHEVDRFSSSLILISSPLNLEALLVERKPGGGGGDQFIGGCLSNLFFTVVSTYHLIFWDRRFFLFVCVSPDLALFRRG